ncbi:MAG TPA: site-2 protease family protein [Syntrophorhabdaceae bacterium]|nr:site-2 protease family protein [Syntrophorhabdaceae bacterium]
MLMISVAAFMIVITVIVLVHEFGHFLAAKKAGVKVYEFSIGFPFTPRLVTLFHYHETAFTIRLLPLGGFVSFSQEGDESGTELLTLPYLKRALIFSAGSLCNMLFAFVVFTFVFVVVKHLDPVTAVLTSLKQVWQILSGTILFIVQAISGQGTMDGVAGPLGIAAIAGKAAVSGFADFCYLTAALSMSIGLCNLLPLPALDGGHLVVLLTEAIRRKPVSLKVYQTMTLAGLALFLLFTAAVTYKDVMRLVA